jgi:hypothetical protein
VWCWGLWFPPSLSACESFRRCGPPSPPLLHSVGQDSVDICQRHGAIERTSVFLLFRGRFSSVYLVCWCCVYAEKSNVCAAVILLCLLKRCASAVRIRRAFSECCQCTHTMRSSTSSSHILRSNFHSLCCVIQLFLNLESSVF